MKRIYRAFEELKGLSLYCTNGHDIKKEGLYKRGEYYVCKRCIKEGVAKWRKTPRGRKRALRSAKKYYWKNKDLVLRKAKEKRLQEKQGRFPTATPSSQTTRKVACG